jgi:hypothetical protein
MAGKTIHRADQFESDHGAGMTSDGPPWANQPSTVCLGAAQDWKADAHYRQVQRCCATCVYGAPEGDFAEYDCRCAPAMKAAAPRPYGDNVLAFGRCDYWLREPVACRNCGRVPDLPEVRPVSGGSFVVNVRCSCGVAGPGAAGIAAAITAWDKTQGAVDESDEPADFPDYLDALRQQLAEAQQTASSAQARLVQCRSQVERLRVLSGLPGEVEGQTVDAALTEAVQRIACPSSSPSVQATCANCGDALLRGVDAIWSHDSGGDKTFCSQYCYRHYAMQGALCIAGRKPGTPKPVLAQQAKDIAVMLGVDWSYCADAEDLLGRIIAMLATRIRNAQELSAKGEEPCPPSPSA